MCHEILEILAPKTLGKPGKI